MLQTTAQRFGSTGKSFVSPSAAAAVIGAALIASGTTDEAETEWSPSAACLLPDVLPVAGTLLSYGGNRQLAAGGTVTHSGDLVLSGSQKALRISPDGVPSGVIYHGGGQNRLYSESSLQPWVVEATAGFKVRNTGNTQDAALTCGPITASTGTFSTSVVTAQLAVSGTAGNDFGILSGTSTRLRLGRISTGTTVMIMELTSSGGGGVTLARGGQIQWSGSTSSAEGGGTTACLVSNDAGIVSVQDGAGGAGALTCGTIAASGVVGINLSGVTNVPLAIQTNATSSDGMYLYNSSGTLVSDFGVTGGGHLRWRFRNSSSTTVVTINTDGVNLAIESGGAIQETPTQSALDPTTTNIPSGKRQGWYNSTLSEFRDWVNIGGTLLKSAAYT